MPAQVYYIDQTENTHSSNAKSPMPEKNSQIAGSQNSKVTQGEQAVRPLIASKPVIINMGLEDFARELISQGVEVLHTDWQPPCGGDRARGDKLSRLG